MINLVNMQKEAKAILSVLDKKSTRGYARVAYLEAENGLVTLTATDGFSLLIVRIKDDTVTDKEVFCLPISVFEYLAKKNNSLTITNGKECFGGTYSIDLETSGYKYMKYPNYKTVMFDMKSSSGIPLLHTRKFKTLGIIAEPMNIKISEDDGLLAENDKFTYMVCGMRKDKDS